MKKRRLSILLALLLTFTVVLPAMAGGANTSAITLQATSNSDCVALQWTPADASGLSGYYVYRSTQPGSASSGTPANDFWCTGTSFEDRNVEKGILYYYTVRPVYGSAIGSPSNEVQVRFGSNTTSPGVTIIMTIGEPQMTVNGIATLIDPPSGQAVPLVVNNRTFVPIRAVVEALGGTISYDVNTKMTTITLDQNTINLWLDSNNIKVNGVDKVMDVAPFIASSRVYLPLRFVIENLNCSADWDGNLYQVTIKRVAITNGASQVTGPSAPGNVIPSAPGTVIPGSTTPGTGNTGTTPVLDIGHPDINGPSVNGTLEPPKQLVTITWAGSWQTSFGILNLTQNGDQVTGTYPDGTLTGTASDKALTGSFAEINSYTGSFTFTMSADGKAFTGTWRYDGDTENSDWTGTRVN
ncbi:MAG: stalk domain-containing protein [Syntrophomonas sp.]